MGMSRNAVTICPIWMRMDNCISKYKMRVIKQGYTSIIPKKEYNYGIYNQSFKPVY